MATILAGKSVPQISQQLSRMQTATNGTQGVVRRLAEDAMRNPLKGVPTQGALQQRIQQRRQQGPFPLQQQPDVANPKMASDRSAARLASLQKVAAADRSAKRLDTLKKCAERNLVKVSEERSALRRLALMKCAGVATDVGATIPTAVAAQIPLVGILPALAGAAGSIGGLVVKPKGDKNPETQATNLIPGVGQFRLAQRSRRMADMSERAGKPGIANLIAEKLGPMTSSLVGAGAGALGGLGLAAAAGGDSRAKGVGAGVGAGVGVAAPLLIAALAAAIKRRRTNAEQIAADTTGRAVAKYLVPGLATYDDYKRLGASGNNDEKQKKTAAVKKANPFTNPLHGALLGGSVGYATTVGDKDHGTDDGQRRALRRIAIGALLGGSVAPLVSFGSSAADYLRELTYG